jgi:hypothetical protein
MSVRKLANRKLVVTPAGWVMLAVALSLKASERMRVVKGPRVLCDVMATSFWSGHWRRL